MEINGVLVKGFERWLQTLGYAKSTVFASVNYLRDFAAWLDENNSNDLKKIDKQTLDNYHNYLQSRKNRRKPGSLSHKTTSAAILGH